MDWLIFECLDCQHRVIGRNMDGCRCETCVNGPLVPVGIPSSVEINDHLKAKRDKERRIMNENKGGIINDGPAPSKEKIVPLSFFGGSVTRKLEYLDRLISLKTAGRQHFGIENRIDTLCDSIEEELGITASENEVVIQIDGKTIASALSVERKP